MSLFKLPVSFFSKRAFSFLLKTGSPESSFCAAVIAAAGSSLRFPGEDKLLCEINGRPLLAYTLDAFEACPPVKEIIVVTKESSLEHIAGIVKDNNFRKVSKVIAGGETRALSVMNGVFAASPRAKLIAVHDGARPCVTPALIEQAIKTAAKYHAAAPGVAVISTLKKAHTPAGRGFGTVITETVGRDSLYEIQTPQVFRTELIKAGLTNAVKKNITLTDDCMAVESLNVPVHITEGSRSNIKVTEREDLEIVKAILTGK